MGIYIKNMEMPKSCDECSFCDGEAWCLIPGNWRLRYNIAHGKRLSTCPLIPIPEHGDLIDRNTLYKEFERNGWFDNADRDIAEDVLLDTPTIIPAAPQKEET